MIEKPVIYPPNPSIKGGKRIVKEKMGHIWAVWAMNGVIMGTIGT
jgi:hypothetical protein